MKVVQVTASRDYEGTVWTALFSSLEKAYEDLSNQPADTFAGVDDLGRRYWRPSAMPGRPSLGPLARSPPATMPLARRTCCPLAAPPGLRPASRPTTSCAAAA